MDIIEIFDNGAKQSKLLGRYDLLSYSGVKEILDYSTGLWYDDDILTPLLGAANVYTNEGIDDRILHTKEFILVALLEITKELIGLSAVILDSLDIIAEVVAGGEKKYGAWNWRGIPVESHLNHAVNHYLLHVQGDTSEPHLEHVLTRCFFALSLISGLV